MTIRPTRNGSNDIRIVAGLARIMVELDVTVALDAPIAEAVTDV
jgi:hypothetical protein